MFLFHRYKAVWPLRLYLILSYHRIESNVWLEYNPHWPGQTKVCKRIPSLLDKLNRHDWLSIFHCDLNYDQLFFFNFFPHQRHCAKIELAENAISTLILYSSCDLSWILSWIDCRNCTLLSSMTESSDHERGRSWAPKLGCLSAHTYGRPERLWEPCKSAQFRARRAQGSLLLGTAKYSLQTFFTKPWIPYLPWFLPPLEPLLWQLIL